MIIKVLICIVGVFLLLIFALPLVSVKLNIGNLFGVCYSILLVACGAFFDYLFAKICLILMLTFTIFYSITLSKAISVTKAKWTECNAVIILGCRVKGDKPSLALIERCKAGANYLKQHKDSIVILSGGQGDDELISEAECMRRLMIEHKIESNRIALEEKSTSTTENLVFSKKILNKYGIKDNIAIVSSDYHLYRAGIIAKDAGFNKITLIPSKTIWYCKPTFFTREVFGIWAKKLKIKE